ALRGTGLRPFCPIPDDPKLLDFRPVEAHSSKHHRLRIDQASVAERRAALPRAREHVHFVRIPGMPPGHGADPTKKKNREESYETSGDSPAARRRCDREPDENSGG